MTAPWGCLDDEIHHRPVEIRTRAFLASKGVKIPHPFLAEFDGTSGECMPMYVENDEALHSMLETAKPSSIEIFATDDERPGLELAVRLATRGEVH